MRIAAVVASGLLVAGLFPPFNFSWLAWVAMIPFLAVIWTVEGKRPGLKGLGLGFLGGAASCLIQFNWVSTVSWLGAIMLPLYLALYWALFGWFAATLGRPRKISGSGAVLRVAFWHGSAWAGLELLRGWMLTGFGWNSMGVAFHETPVMAQGADLLGVTGLSFVLIFVQAVVVLAARDVLSGGKRLRWDVIAAGVFIVALFGYGKFRIQSEAQAESVRLKALLVQLNIPQEAARVLWTDLETHMAYEEETLEALESLKTPEGDLSNRWPDWVMWPECALTGRIFFTEQGEKASWQINHDTIAQVRTAGPFSLIYGVNEQEAVKDGDYLVPKERGRAYNSVAAMSPENALQTYRKHHLVIFGETIPFVDSVPFLKWIYEQQSGGEYGGSFTPGESLDPLPILAGKTEIGAIPSVCFEDSVPRLTRKFLRPGPQVIVNVTNDGWFKESAASAQHFAYARFRAIELRRPMLRCANTGVSAAVDSAGSTAHPDTGVRQVLEDRNGNHFTRGSLLTEVNVPLEPTVSLFAIIGNWGVVGLSFLTLIWTWMTRKFPRPVSVS